MLNRWMIANDRPGVPGTPVAMLVGHGFRIESWVVMHHQQQIAVDAAVVRLGLGRLPIGGDAVVDVALVFEGVAEVC